MLFNAIDAEDYDRMADIIEAGACCCVSVNVCYRLTYLADDSVMELRDQEGREGFLYACAEGKHEVVE